MFTRGLLLFLFTSFSLCTFAQNTRTGADSTALRELWQYPRKNSLPVQQPFLLPENVSVPKAVIDLRVNYWRNTIAFGINFNQASFSDNWSGGGVNSLALGSQFNYKAEYTRDDKNFVSELLLQYGKLKNKNQLERKTNDRIFWDNKMGLKLSDSWNFFGSVNFESQFDRGYSYGKDIAGKETRSLISRFLSPGYLTESLGFEYKPVKYFSLRIGTGTARQTFVLDTSIYRNNSKNFGVEPGKRFRNELAFQMIGSIDKDIAQNLNLKSRYSIFANYEHLGGIDHRLDLTLTARITRIINVSLSGVALYDDDTNNRIQASEGLSLGLTYKIPK